MSEIGQRSGFFTINRPEWQARLPRGLRTAAEWQFGTWIVFAVLATIQGELIALPMSLAFSFFLFLLLSGWSEGKRFNSPVTWWVAVVGFSLLAAFGAVILLVDPPE